MGPLRRILLACVASVMLYVIAFGCLLDRPLTLGALRARIETNLARGAAIRGPKLVILAGSNGPYSHRCETIEPIIGRPCVNAGVAVGVGLDYLFARWETLLHPGDMVYLPLEETQVHTLTGGFRARTGCRDHAAARKGGSVGHAMAPADRRIVLVRSARRGDEPAGDDASRRWFSRSA